uniref:Vacuolar fusion protein MON1 homolog n=1 Tax=Glossina brevipalpis TaxID=37001 RepID=A0A1A9WDX0_9MUSC
MDPDADYNIASDIDKVEHEIFREDEDTDGVTEKMVEGKSPTTSDTLVEFPTGKRQIAGNEDRISRVSINYKDLWRFHKKHVFVMTSEGEPIFSLNGYEHNLLPLFRLIYLTVNTFKNVEDEIDSIEASGMRFAFLSTPTYIVAAISKTQSPISQLKKQLDDIYNQVLSFEMFSKTKALENDLNFLLKRLLKGGLSLMQNLANNASGAYINKNVFTALTNSIQILPLKTSVRSSIENIIKAKCKRRVHNVIFVLLIIDNQLVTLLHKKNITIDPSDLRLILNFVKVLRPSEYEHFWYRPFFLPRYENKNDNVHAYFCKLTTDCPACLIFISTSKDDFTKLMIIKKSISKKMVKTVYPSVINEAVETKRALLSPTTIGVPQMIHFLYKPRHLQQLICNEFSGPNPSWDKFRYVEDLYTKTFDRIHKSDRPLKLLYESRKTEILVGWLSSKYELYALFETDHSKREIIEYLNKIVHWVKKENFDKLFINHYPIF